MRFYTKNSPPNSWSLHFMITFRNQKSRNVRTPCIPIPNVNWARPPRINLYLLILQSCNSYSDTVGGWYYKPKLLFMDTIRCGICGSFFLSLSFSLALKSSTFLSESIITWVKTLPYFNMPLLVWLSFAELRGE